MKHILKFDPFPSSIDRNAFSHWLSGFSAGEATFLIYAPNGHNGKPSPRANFRITLRDDDSDVVRLIHSFWQCGGTYRSSNERCKMPNAKPVISYYVTKISDLETVVVPHFEAFPLIAKKAFDFQVWRKAVLLLAKVSKREPKRHRNDAGTRFIGCESKWSPDELCQFQSYITELKSTRSYAAPLDLIPARYSDLSQPKT
jgi:hypothetical protein